MQFPFHARKDFLAVIELASRQFERNLTDRMAILPNEHNRLFIEEGNDADRPGMIEVFAERGLSVWESNLIDAEIDGAPPINWVFPNERFNKAAIAARARFHETDYNR